MVLRWDKNQKPKTRRKVLLGLTDKRKSLKERYLEASKIVGAVANFAKDRVAKRKARLDRVYFLKKYRGKKK